MEPAKQPVDLNLISSTCHHECLGVPPELTNYIMDMLRDDPQTLKACSLTCKAMFASARHLIHRTLYLTLQNNQNLLAEERKKGIVHKRGDQVLRFLSHMGEQGLLRYTTQVHIDYHGTFIPEYFRPHLRHFKSLDRVHSLTIHNFNVIRWENHHKSYFGNLYPTLTSLSLRSPVGHYREFLRFALQFPNLESLCIEKLDIECVRRHVDTNAIIVTVQPPLSGTLRLDGAMTDVSAQLVEDLAYNLPNGIRFRSIELQQLAGHQAQHLVNACRGTLEHFTVISTGQNFQPQLSSLDLGEATVLRRLTFHAKGLAASVLHCGPFLRALSTIKSPVFREVVIEVEGYSRGPHWKSVLWGDWSKIDRHLDELFSMREDGQLVFRAHKFVDHQSVKTQAMKLFPRLVERGRFRFETSGVIGKSWY